jgi:DNA-binding SARP family transcriptional activator
VESHPTGYRLNADVDAREFELRVREARQQGHAAKAAGLREALAMWRGPALADVAGAPFADAPIARLEGLRRAALQERIDADLRLGRHAEVIPELEALTAADPLSEQLAVVLIKALYGAGRQADALEVYTATRQALDDQLGIDPSEELEQVRLAVLRHELDLPSPAVETATNLKAHLTSFIGRDDDLNRVAKLLGERAHALLHRLALIGESELRALRGQLLRNPPGERTVVGEAHDQASLPCHQAGHSLSSSVPSTLIRSHGDR